MSDLPCICGVCEHRQATMDPCERCGSVRTGVLSALENCEPFEDDQSPQLELAIERGDHRDQLIVLAMGGGVNSVAAAVLLHRDGFRPTAIVMCNPGSEWAHTVAYRDGVFSEWCDSVGFPRPTVIDRISEGAHNPRAWRLETLRDECMRIGSLPSIAYGFKKCSAKYKGDTSRWWIARQPWALAEWAAGRRIAKVIGYDAGEPGRVRAAFQNPWENQRMVPWYPLYDGGFDRDGCIELIKAAGLPEPGKSACTYCPSNTIDEWRLLRKIEPDRFAEAVEMSRNAEIDSPDVVGLMRCAPHGQRQLHVWVDAGMPQIRGEQDAPLPCECAL